MSPANILSFVTESSERKAAVERYESMYGMVEKTRRFADTIRLGGIFAGGMLVVAATVAYEVVRAQHLGRPVAAWTLIAFAIFVPLVTHIWSRFFVAQACLLEATIDSAVNSSPFLIDVERSDVMRLHEGKAKARAVQDEAA